MRNFSLALLLCSALSTVAQKQAGIPAATQKQADLSSFSAMKPRAIGPAGMSGRVTSVDALSSDPNTIIIGSASGGVWKTTNGGSTWTPIFDEQPTLNIGSVAIQQNNPQVIWAGTGEGNPRNSLNLGEGIYKTLDGGRSWKKMGLDRTLNIHRIIIHPQEPNTVYVGAIGNPYGEHPERGVYKTTDGGMTWEKILYTNDTSGVGDMIMDPSNPNKLFVAMWQHRRQPWNLLSGGKGSGLFMTVDGGKNWKKLDKEAGLPAGDLGRIGLAISRSNPNRVYALVEATKNGLYRSNDGGYTWELVNSDPRWVTNRPFYFQDIACDPQNENRLYLIYQVISVSEDGGKTFEQLEKGSGLHADHHAFWINPQDGRLIIDGNDGGIGISRDRGRTWVSDENLPFGQFYHINVDNQVPYNIMGGMQDNSSWHGPAYLLTSGGIRNDHWTEVQGGDGFDVMSDPADPNWIYAMSQGGNLVRYNKVTGERAIIRPPAENPRKPYRFNWNAALAQDPFDAGTIYYGSQFLHKSTDRGNNWSIISPDLTTNDSTKTDQSNNGGLSIDITGAETFCTILTIAPSAREKGVIWIGTDDGNVQLTRDGGRTWTNFRGRIPGMPVGSWIPQIQASRHNGAEAFVVCNDYRRGDFKPYIFHTADYGKTWSRIVDERKLRGYALCVLQDTEEPNLLFVGTEHGLWVSFDKGVSFQQWKNGYPSVSTYDMVLQEREADLVIGSFGRSLWVLDNIRPLRYAAANKGIMPKKMLTVLKTGDALQYNVRNAPGQDRAAWGIWEGPNKQRGAMLNYIIMPGATDSALKKSDSVEIRILNSRNELVRTLKAKADTGLNITPWGMEQDGFRLAGPSRFPSRGVPPGLPALSGSYKAVIRFRYQVDSVAFNVLDDPMSGNRNAEKQAKMDMVAQLRKSNDKLIAGLERLNDADELLNKMDNQLKGVTGRQADSLRRATRVMKDSVKNIRASIVGGEREKQGYYGGFASEVNASSQLAQAFRYISGKVSAPGPQEQMLLRNAEDYVRESVGRINSFFAGPWKNYRTHAESTRLDLFKDYSPIPTE